MPILLPSHQAKLERSLSGLSNALRRVDCRVQASQARRVSTVRKLRRPISSNLTSRLKRLQLAKKLRDKRRKEDAAVTNRLANVRVRQRAQVHIQGMTTKVANEETLAQLKGPDQFGKYGKVQKLFLSKRTPAPGQPASSHPLFQPVNVYINYRTPQEAANCISAVDGTTVEGHRLKAVWGTTRYCPTYLKGLKCNNENCMQAHEPGEEIGEAGPASREEIYT